MCDPTQQNPVRYTQMYVPSAVDLGVIAMKLYSTLPRFPELHHQLQYHTQDILGVGGSRSHPYAGDRGSMF